MNQQHPPKKLTKKQKDDLLAAHLPGLLSYHYLMLSDGVRNKLLFQAIQQHVNENTSFLDIGAGTGVWAILAAKLGAKRVVAIEIEEPLIPLIFKHAQENGVANKIEIIHGNADHVKLKGKFDVIVSELFGQDALGEGVTKSFVNLRNRFLAPNGILIPQKLSMLAAPVKLDKSPDEFPVGLPLTASYLKTVKFNYSSQISIERREKTEVLTEPQLLMEMNFKTVETAPDLKSLAAGWKMNNLSEANAIAVFNRSTFTEEIIMDSFNSQSWGASIYEFQPVSENDGEIYFNLNMDGAKSRWAVTTKTESGIKTQNFSPTFAPARIKMAQQMTPFRKVRPPKQNLTETKKNSKK